MTGNESRDDAFKKGTIFAAAGPSEDRAGFHLGQYSAPPSATPRQPRRPHDHGDRAAPRHGLCPRAPRNHHQGRCPSIQDLDTTSPETRRTPTKRTSGKATTETYPYRRPRPEQRPRPAAALPASPGELQAPEPSGTHHRSQAPPAGPQSQIRPDPARDRSRATSRAGSTAAAPRAEGGTLERRHQQATPPPRETATAPLDPADVQRRRSKEPPRAGAPKRTGKEGPAAAAPPGLCPTELADDGGGEGREAGPRAAAAGSPPGARGRAAGGEGREGERAGPGGARPAAGGGGEIQVHVHIQVCLNVSDTSYGYPYNVQVPARSYVPGIVFFASMYLV
nr:translation initiation factor IF-2-like [Aegilops tauschii subsp. strangulata]